MTKESIVKKYPTIACCGLDCGLCPVYYTEGPSRCPGCCGPDFYNKHPSCSIITCCVKNHKFETCAECNEFPCSKIDKWDKFDSFISHRVSLSNLRLIKKEGLNKFLTQQKKRIGFLENMLENFNDGRSKSFFCLATALIPLDDLECAWNKSTEQIMLNGIKKTDLKTRASILKKYCNQYAEKKNIELKIRKR
ncbi:MAG: DUF3795 domain-containing protein [Candidatus Hodarchaeota archaeon]